MNSSSASANPNATDWMRPLRYLARVPLLVLHLVIALPITLFFMNPIGAALKSREGGRLDHWFVRWWSGVLMRIFGFRVTTRGTPLRGATLLVANHVTWCDIELIHSQRMACFVAKSEIAGWPLVGWLAARAGTIYHKRGSTASLASVAQVMVERLREGLAVAVFPEGGTGPGDHVRTFHARIFQAAVDAGVPAQPVALRFSRGGIMTTAVAFRDKEKFAMNFFRLLGEPRTDAEVIFLDPITDVGQGRRKMAEAARAQIVAALGLPDVRRSPRTSEAEEPETDDLDPLANGEASG